MYYVVSWGMPKSEIAEDLFWCKNLEYYSYPLKEMYVDSFPLTMYLQLTSLFLYGWFIILYLLLYESKIQ